MKTRTLSIALALVASGCASTPAETTSEAATSGALTETEAGAEGLARGDGRGPRADGDGPHADGDGPHADGHGPHAEEHGGHGGHLGHGHHAKTFQDAAAWAERFDDPARDAWQKPASVVEAMAIEPGMTVADIGAGTGYFLPYLSAAVGTEGQVWGLDVEPTMVEWMQERAARDGLDNVSARAVAGDDPGFDAASIDRILLVNTWHHVPDRTAYAAKLAAGLRPGGAVYVVDYTLDAEAGPPREHRLAPETVIAELAAGGLEGEIVAVDLPKQYVVVARPAADE